MKTNHFLLLILLFASSFTFSQTLERIEVQGQIIADHQDIEGVTIYNTSSNKGTVTDIEGKFILNVSVNDRVEVSALQFEKFKIVITQEIIDAKSMTVFLVERINKLDEILILPYGLTGNLETDLDKAKTVNPNLDALYFGIQEMDQYEFTEDYKSEVVNMAMTQPHFKNGVDFVKIIGGLFKPIFKSGNKNDEISASDSSMSANRSIEFLMRRLNISQEEINKFVEFVEDNDFDTSLLEEGKEFEFLEHLINQSKIFQEKRAKN